MIKLSWKHIYKICTWCGRCNKMVNTVDITTNIYWSILAHKS